ncbi:Mg/Co/Ni transporter MgtE [Fusibacter sp. 3D3]|nr:Mg/Co/Ni transporter MgtE [Fusibacter sp. 3D3]
MNENVLFVYLGIITVDDIIDVIVEEQTEDLLMLSGVSKDEEVGSPLAVSIHRRLHWQQLCPS